MRNDEKCPHFTETIFNLFQRRPSGSLYAQLNTASHSEANHSLFLFKDLKCHRSGDFCIPPWFVDALWAMWDWNGAEMLHHWSHGGDWAPSADQRRRSTLRASSESHTFMCVCVCGRWKVWGGLYKGSRVAVGVSLSEYIRVWRMKSCLWVPPAVWWSY